MIVSDQARNGWESALQKGGRWEGYDPEVAVIAWEVVGKVPNAGIAEAQKSLVRLNRNFEGDTAAVRHRVHGIKNQVS